MANIWEETKLIPSYKIGRPQKNPFFLEKRVYQGSSGKVYPFPVIEKIYEEKEDKPYQIVFLENEYIQVQLMPEIGGRIYRYLDKTNGYEAVYYNRVIKPALVGLAGPWISGGIEFNWPQHHRPNTFGRVEYYVEKNDDGICTCWMTEVDRMYGTECSVAFSIYPGKSFLEIRVSLYNRTAVPQTFLWWANPAVHVHDQTQSIFPPDVHAVFDHGKRDLSRFPIATGTYYKVDYSAGVDISWYKNVPVPTSYMAYHSKYDFLGGYDHSKQAGILHIADHHVSPGKKQWTWGCGNFGDVWHQQLTDDDGPYVELMAGVYTDNQPDFTWMKPYEQKTFTQYFLPYKEVGVVQNANIDFAISMKEESDGVCIRVYASSSFEQVTISLKNIRNGKTYYQNTVNVSPLLLFSEVVQLHETDVMLHFLQLAVYSTTEGRELISYVPEGPHLEKFPEAAKAIGAPEQLTNTESLFLAGTHLEQYRHATYRPEDYYLEGLKRDREDIRLNNAYGLLLLRHGQVKLSESYFRQAIATATRHNPNPYDCAPFYYLGLCLKWQKKWNEAFDAFYKAIWDTNYHSIGYYQLACICIIQKNYTKALEFIEESLKKDYSNMLARNAKITILRKLERHALALSCCEQILKENPLHVGALFEKWLLKDSQKQDMNGTTIKQNDANWTKVLNRQIHHCLALAEDYWELGCYREGQIILDYLIDAYHEKHGEIPFIVYYATAFLMHEDGPVTESSYETYLKTAETANIGLHFATSLFEMFILEYACEHTSDYKPYYMLGNLLYDKRRYNEAISYWEKCTKLAPTFPTAFRNLSLASFNKLKNPKKAKEYMERAFELDSSDARILFELDKLYRTLRVHPTERLQQLEKYDHLVVQRDDLIIEKVTLLNWHGKNESALSILLGHVFHPWEGGEGKVISQYVFCCIELAKKCLQENEADAALWYLKRAISYPSNLGEGKLEGARENHIFYFMGLAYAQKGDKELSKKYYQQATEGSLHLETAMFYNDQPPELLFYQGLSFRKIGDEQNAKRCFHRLRDYGEVQLFKELKVDYFAVSLPNMLIFEEDLNNLNEIQSRFLLALGYMGLLEYENAQQQLDVASLLEPSHLGVKVHSYMLQTRSLL
eukprot:jgi/Galph1/6048/GphlegSOOS_G4674.1